MGVGIRIEILSTSKLASAELHGIAAAIRNRVQHCRTNKVISISDEREREAHEPQLRCISCA